jgi:Ala-tRNA(Pro) deacylase
LNDFDRLGETPAGGMPAASTLSAEEGPVVARLEALGIRFERYVHPPIDTAESGREYWAGIDALHCKNLFLRNQKGTRHYLVIFEYTKRADLRAVANQIGDGKLSFASSERLQTYLGVTPGSVSAFGLIHDRNHHVQVFLDRGLKRAARISFHPNINTATLVLAWSDFQRFLTSCGNYVGEISVEGA